MNYKNFIHSLFYLGLILLSSSCGINNKSTQLETEKNYLKNNLAITACNAIRLPRDIEFTGAFLNKFLSCLNESDSQGKEKYEATQRLFQTLGADGLDEITELLLFRPSNQNLNTSSNNDFPFLRAGIHLMERGLFEGLDNNSNYEHRRDLKEERMTHLQKFLLDFYPRPAINFFQNLNKENKLETLAQLFLDFSAGPSPLYISSYGNQILLNKELQSNLYSSTNNFFNDSIIQNSLDKMVKIESGTHLNLNDKKICLKEWETPALLPLSEENGSCSLSRGTGSENGHELYKKLFLQNISKPIKNEISKALAEMQQGLFKSNNPTFVLEKWKRSIQETIETQSAPLQHYLGVLNFYLASGPENKTPEIKDMDEVVTALQEILEQSGPPAFLSLNVKMGSSKLHRAMELFIYNGGPAHSCSGLNLPGLKEKRGPSEWQKIYQQYITPHPLCPYQMAPLYSEALFYLSSKIGINFPCSLDESDSCISEEQLKIVASILNHNNKSQNIETEEISSEDLKVFVVTALKDLEQKQKDNSMAIHQLNVGPANYPLVKLRSLINTIENEESLSIEKLMAFEEKGLTPSSYFFEEYLAFYLRQEKQNISNWNGLITNQAHRDLKARNVFQGLNPNSYFEKAAHNLFKLKNIPEKIINKIDKKDLLRLQGVLFRLQSPGNFFKNKRLDSFESDTPWFTSGQEKRSVEILYQKVGNEFHIQPPELNKSNLVAQEVFQNDLTRLATLLNEDIILSKDFPKDSHDHILKWFQKDFYPYLSSELSWDDYLDQFHSKKDTFNLDQFITAEKYSLHEKRAVAFFLSQNYLMATNQMPQFNESYSIEKIIQKRKPDIRTNFLSLPSEGDNFWDLFLKGFPHVLGEESNSVENLIKNFVNQFTVEDWNNVPWNKMPIDKKEQRELRGVSGKSKFIIQSLSTLQLLTINSQKKYVPFIGLDKECEKSANSYFNCPVTFKDFQSRNGETINAFLSFKNYLYDRTLTYFCPYLIKDGPFSNDAQKEIAKELQLVAENKETINFCQKLWSEHNLVTGVEGQEKKKGLPFKSVENILGNFFHYKKNPQLSPRLNQVIASIKNQKDLALAFKDKEQQAINWLNSPIESNEEINEYSSKVLADHKGFYSKNPGQLNSRLYFLNSLMAEQGGAFAQGLWRMGNSLTVSDDLKKGSAQRFVEEILIPLYRKHQNPNAPLVYFLSDVSNALLLPENNELRNDLFYSLTYPEDLETYATLNKTLPLFLNHIYSKNGSDKLWGLPALDLMRPFVLQENFRAISQLSNRFSPEEVIQFSQYALKSIHYFSDKNLFLTLASLNQLAQGLFLRLSTDGPLFLDDFKNNIQQLLKTDFLVKNSLNINALFNSFNQSHSGFGNNEKLKMSDSLPFLNYLFIDHSTDLFSLYQNRQFPIDLELKQISLGLIAPFKEGKNELGAKAVSHILGTNKILSWQKLAHPFIFDPINQKKIFSLMKRINKMANEDLSLALRESDSLLKQSYNFLNYTLKRIRWSDTLSADAKMALLSLGRLASSTNEIFIKQIDIALHWLQNDINLQESKNIRENN